MSTTTKIERLTKEVTAAGAVINELVRENFELRTLLAQKLKQKPTPSYDRPRAPAEELSSV